MPKGGNSILLKISQKSLKKEMCIEKVQKTNNNKNI
jgi:hypothetical protein